MSAPGCFPYRATVKNFLLTMRRFRRSVLLTPGCLFLGMAPGLEGPNQTGRPFTNRLRRRPSLSGSEKIRLCHRQLGNAPMRLSAGRRTGHQQRRCACRRKTKSWPKKSTTAAVFFVSELEALDNLKIILALGGVAHKCLARHARVP